jgi:hypothetical protein
MVARRSGLLSSRLRQVRVGIALHRARHDQLARRLTLMARPRFEMVSTWLTPQGFYIHLRHLPKVLIVNTLGLRTA